MYKILINEAALQNLKVFLERITMTGKEVPAYIEILQAIQKAEEEVK